MRQMPEVRFWSKVDIGAAEDCWRWLGATTRKGYGQFRVDGRTEQAHRHALTLVGVDLGDGHALHRCHNPACCNPGHLRPGSNAENMRDKAMAGRAPRQAGEQNNNAKLSASQVVRIRILFKSGLSVAAIARHLGTPYRATYKAARRLTWRHVG